MPEYCCDVIKAVTLSIKNHNLGTDQLPIEDNVQITLSEAEVWLDRDWVIPTNLQTIDYRKSVAKGETKKWTQPY